MFDLDAPIIPGESAAGIQLGDPMLPVLEQVEPRQTVGLGRGKRHEFGPVSLWAEYGTITQIGLYAGYRGALAKAIRIGSTLQDVRDKLGPVVEDEEDNLVVENHPGWCFETENRPGRCQVEPDPEAKITEIYVFASII